MQKITCFYCSPPTPPTPSRSKIERIQFSLSCISTGHFNSHMSLLSVKQSTVSQCQSLFGLGKTIVMFFRFPVVDLIYSCSPFNFFS